MSEQVRPERRNAHLTHKANIGVGRHGWLRLTPAYSVRLVRERIAHLPPGSVVTDPFSGTGTTPLAAVEHGCTGQSIDVNPFLIWLGNAKVRHYPAEVVTAARDALAEVAALARRLLPESAGLWRPELRNIERWWPAGALAALAALRHALDEAELPKEARDLLTVAFCRTVIGSSNAAFNHQSMSFRDGGAAGSAGGQVSGPGASGTKAAGATLDGAGPDGAGSADAVPDGAVAVVARFEDDARAVLRDADADLPGSGAVVLGDSRTLADLPLRRCDLLLTSPPYVNRMSYIRELRPYMYWTRFLDVAGDAGELDWRAIGGTWGVATSRLKDWRPDDRLAAIDGELREVRSRIERDGGPNGPLLSAYVAKYFHDMAAHFRAAFDHIRVGGHAAYIVGNSTFYGHLVPVERWYAALLREAGFTDVAVRVVRKRNSNKALYEYEVAARRP